MLTIHISAPHIVHLTPSRPRTRRARSPCSPSTTWSCRARGRRARHGGTVRPLCGRCAARSLPPASSLSLSCPLTGAPLSYTPQPQLPPLPAPSGASVGVRQEALHGGERCRLLRGRRAPVRYLVITPSYHPTPPPRPSCCSAPPQLHPLSHQLDPLVATTPLDRNYTPLGASTRPSITRGTPRSTP